MTGPGRAVSPQRRPGENQDHGISAYQNQFVDSLVNELTARLQVDAKA
jgi:hypothetical protein